MARGAGRRALPSFEDIRQDVWESIVAATNDYAFLTDLVLPLAKQRRLHGDYPFVTSTLVRTASEHILLAICRLFDPDPDPRMASLTTFLGGVVAHHAVVREDVPSRTRERRDEFDRAIPERLAAIKRRWKLLSQHRNAYLAHRDLTKLEMLPAMTHPEIVEAIAWAQGVYGAYQGAYGTFQPHWRLAELDTEPKGFLKWCRLDDYATHLTEHRRALKARHYPAGQIPG